jgi:hypothetical protein
MTTSMPLLQDAIVYIVIFYSFFKAKNNSQAHIYQKYVMSEVQRMIITRQLFSIHIINMYHMASEFLDAKQLQYKSKIKNMLVTYYFSINMI